MARSWFGGSIADFTVTLSPEKYLVATASTVTFWDSKTGGAQYTDLLVGGLAASSVTTDAFGQLPRFQGPDVITEMWADAGGTRVLIATTDRTAASTGGGSGLAVVDNGDGTLTISSSSPTSIVDNGDGTLTIGG